MSVLMINKMIPKVGFLILLSSVCPVVILYDFKFSEINKEMVLVYTDFENVSNLGLAYSRSAVLWVDSMVSSPLCSVIALILSSLWIN